MTEQEAPRPADWWKELPDQWWLNRALLIDVFEYFDWNETKVWKATGIPRGTLANGRRKFGIHLSKNRGDAKGKRAPVINPGVETSIENRIRREFEDREAKLTLKHQRETEEILKMPRMAEPHELSRARQQVLVYKQQADYERRIADDLTKRANLVEGVKKQISPYLEALTLPAVAQPALPEGEGNPISLMVSLNDWHWGKKFDAAMMKGLNAFNPNIAAARAQLVTDVVLRWANNYANMGNPVETLYVVLNGDMANGNLHPEDESNYAGTMVQILDCSLVLAQILTEWSWFFPNIVVIKPSGDNHLRTTHRSVTSAKAYETGLDTLMAHTISALTRGTKHIEYRFDKAHQTLLNIYGRTWAICHGNLIKGGGGQLGIPAYGMARHQRGNLAETVAMAKRTMQTLEFDEKLPMEQKLDKLMGALEGLVDHTLLAHFHSRQVLEMAHGEVFIAPTLMGSDPYAKDIIRAGAGVARQMMWALHPEQDIIGEHFVNLQHIMDPESTSRYHWGALDLMQDIGSMMDDWLNTNRRNR